MTEVELIAQQVAEDHFPGRVWEVSMIRSCGAWLVVVSPVERDAASVRVRAADREAAEALIRIAAGRLVDWSEFVA